MDVIALSLVLLPVVTLIYSYAAYPAILWLLARLKPRPAWPESSQPTVPMVTVVLPAYNEERQIAGAIESALAQDYPADRLQILVVSDASTDQTDAIVAQYASRGVELLRMPTRGGKTAAENAACAVLRGEIVLNSDASIRLHRLAIRRLVECMTDPSVGVASGRDVSVAVGETAANSAEAGYVGYEMWLRGLETRVDGIVGASGSCYAIRADLHRIPIRRDLSRDFSAALTARLHGYRTVSADEALCYVPRTRSLKGEYWRKVRTIARGMETLLQNRQLLDPTRFGLFGWMLFSHKICRWLVPWTALLGLLGLILLAPMHWSAAALVAGAFILLTVAATGAKWPDARPMPRPVSLISFGIAANLAAVHAFLRVLWGREDHIWEPTRREGAPATS
jgi:cellulose synthase/poly-beta-1,6-N-acetylglucosamine synthase-like glycosyltransferase